jgi:hypothetical protein
MLKCFIITPLLLIYILNPTFQMLTGSKDVSIRDHLFDLTLPPPARPELDERHEQSSKRTLNPNRMRPLHAPKHRYSSESPRSAFHLLPPEAKCDEKARRSGSVFFHRCFFSFPIFCFVFFFLCDQLLLCYLSVYLLI